MSQQVSVVSVVKVWEKDGKKIYGVTCADGLTFKAWGDSGITEATSGQIEVDLSDKPDRDGKMEKWGRVAGRGNQGGGKKFTPRDYAAEERAKHPSFALSYAKDITAAIIAAKGEQGGKTFDVEAFTLTLADKFLGWLTAHAPKSAPVQQDAKTPDGWIAAIQAAGLGQAVKDAKLQRADMEAWYAQNPAGFIERVKEAIEGSSLPF